MQNTVEMLNLSSTISPTPVDFKNLFENFCALTERTGMNILPYRTESDLQRFENISEVRRKNLFTDFQAYLAVCTKTLEEGVGLEDSLSLTWNMISRLGLRPAGDLFDKLHKDDVIEIYDRHGVQIYRNIKFFEICSYSLTELFTYEWWELYKRDGEILVRLIDMCMQVLNGQKPYTFYTQLEAHTAEEIFSPEKHKYLIEQKVLSPLYDKNNDIVAYVATFKILQKIPKDN